MKRVQLVLLILCIFTVFCYYQLYYHVQNSPLLQKHAHIDSGAVLDFKNFTELDEVIIEVVEPHIEFVAAQARYDASTNCVLTDFTHRVTVDRSPMPCVPHKSPSDACKSAKNDFYQDDKLKKCDSDTIRVCQAFEHNRKEADGTVKISFTYKCSVDACPTGHVTVRVTNAKSRLVEAVRTYSNSKKLEEELEGIAVKTSSEGFHYIFLDCTDSHGKRNDFVGQFMILPSYHLVEYVQANEEKKKRGQEVPEKVSVNIFFIDSVSRQHFFRSLPTTHAMLSTINSDPSNKAEVLEFELFQSLDSHSNEHLHAMNTGVTWPQDWSDDKRSEADVEYKQIYSNFTKAGYWTMTSSDISYDWNGALRNEMGMKDTIEEFDAQLKDNHVNSTGIYWSLRYFYKYVIQRPNPYGGPDKICYNGKFMFTEHLNYVYQQSEFGSRHNVPSFTFFTTHINHESGGRRIQTLDWDLAVWVKQMSEVKNTISIFLGDHGNTQTSYGYSTEGKFELYHPFIAIILPDSVVNKLGDQVMSSLRTNQNRMVTMLDLHHMLKSIAQWSDTSKPPVKPDGFLRTLPETRTCSSLPLKVPKCVCEGWDVALDNTTEMLAQAFAVGEINNMLIASQAKLAPSEPYKCHRIFATKFSEVRKVVNGSKVVISFIFVMPAGKGVPQTEDIFVALVEMNTVKSSNREMSLMHYDRTSTYGGYKSCLDSTVHKRLCLCDVGSTSSSTWHTPETTARSNEAGSPKYQYKASTKHSTCLYYVTKKYAAGEIMFEAVNKCSEAIDVTLTAKLSNMTTTERFPITKKAYPHATTSLGGAAKSELSGDIQDLTFSP